MRQHTFTDDEADLICRALRIYADIQKWEMLKDCGGGAHELAQRVKPETMDVVNDYKRPSRCNHIWRHESDDSYDQWWTCTLCRTVRDTRP